MNAEDWITLILTIEFAAIILYMVSGNCDEGGGRMSEELKPCPFCGGEAQMLHAVGEWWAICKFCKATTEAHTNKGFAIAAWNARAGSHCAFAQPTDLTDGCALLTERTCRNVCEEWEKTSLAHAATSFCCPNCGARVIE